jgi:phosphoribosylanthranilate isomerase
MLRVKICGITNLEDALLASLEGADALGFIFSPKSPRCISKQAAQKIIKHLDPFLTKVGVFLDEDKDKVRELASCLQLDVLQFHGKESSSYCYSFKPEFKVIKVFFPQDMPYERKISRYNVDAYMFDVLYDDKTRGKKTLSLQALEEIGDLIEKGKRVIISGGLNADNVDQIKKIKPYAVDVASGIEKLVGKKDKDLLRKFIKRIKI